MYDGKTQFLIKEPDQSLPDQFADAAGYEEERRRFLTIYIQKDSPGADKEANWLPAPNDTIYLAMRALLAEAPSRPQFCPIGKGSWQPPAVERAR